MARLPTEILTAIFDLQQRLLISIDEAKSTEFSILDRFGETDETIETLDQLQNAAERLRTYYNRLHTIALGIAEAQPIAATNMLEFLQQTLVRAEATADAVEASIRELRQDWNP